jgi:UDP-GlcNAc:undecaprenyl-phosphate/decaprenyl-phosphate GlcNAc-1-phosphate transferase
MWKYILPLLISFSVVLAAVPLLASWALRSGFVDRPSARKIHAAPIPLTGGLAIYAGCILSMMIFDGGSSRTWAIALGGALLVITGTLDDWYKTRGQEFPVAPRLFVYTAVACIPLLFGIRIIGITNVIGGNMILFPDWLEWMATILWVFGMTNMVNFIDGVDGLASGIVTISSLTLLVIALITGMGGTAIAAAAVAGSCSAFLVYNFHPAKIFMGDAGAVFLGYTLAVLAVDGTFKSATLISMLVPVLALGVPIMDTMIVFTRRFMEGKGLHRADKLHTHHRLMQWGLTQTQTVSFLYLIGALFSLLSIVVLLAFG